MCKYCAQIARETGESEACIHMIVDRFCRLREADGIYAMRMSPDVSEDFFCSVPMESQISLNHSLFDDVSI
jgi:hypothetical protein